MSTPRGQIVNRSALLKAVETDVAALLEKVSDMDDLVVQFDTGGGQGGTPPTPPTPPPPPPA